MVERWLPVMVLPKPSPPLDPVKAGGAAALVAIEENEAVVGVELGRESIPTIRKRERPAPWVAPCASSVMEIARGEEGGGGSAVEGRVTPSVGA